jgi:hypothetical protein
MAITLAVAGGNIGVSTTLTLPSSYVTKAGDVVIVVIGTANSNWSSPLVTISGLGANWQTWTQTYNSSTSLGGNYFAVGTSCTAGNTTITLSSNPSTNGNVAILVFSGAKSQSANLLFGPIGTATTNTTVSQTGLSWAAGSTLVSFGETYEWASGSPVGTWGSSTETLGAVSGPTRAAYASYVLNAPAGSSATYTSPQSYTGYGVGAVYGIQLTPVPSNGNMFLVMGF